MAPEEEYGAHPVLIVAADTIIGLTVLRSLGRRKVPVYCATTADDALGLHSAYSRGSFVLPRDPDHAIDTIQQYARRWKVTHIAAISEAHIQLLNRSRDILERDYTLLFPASEVFNRAVHKDLTLACARCAGVPAPRTAYPQAADEIEQCRGFQFPVILKMAQPGPASVFRHKYLRVESFEQLRRTLESLPSGKYPMVQEYVPGTGIGVSILMRHREAVLIFQHRRVREFPPEGGIGVFCEAMEPDAELVRHAVRLLTEMAWDGVAMVEYRHDASTGHYALMEVNGRFWGSLPTAIHAGVDFPFWLYRTSLPGACPPPLRYRTGVLARSLAGDTKWLLAVIRSRTTPIPAALAAYLGSFRPSTKYFLWAWDDPKPC